MTTPAILAIRDGIETYFANQGVTAEVLVTIQREFWRQMNQGPGRANRVVLSLIDPERGGGGSYDKSFGPRGPGNLPIYDWVDPNDYSKGKKVVGVEPRPLIGESRSVWVSTWAIPEPDNAGKVATNDDRAVVDAEENLFERTVQAVQRVAHVGGEWKNFRWKTDGERGFGLMRISELAIRSVYFDIDHPWRTPTPAVERGTIS